jgi:hypothetical protein
VPAQAVSAKVPTGMNLVVFPDELQAGSAIAFTNPATGQSTTILGHDGRSARRLAESIYTARRFEDLPVLADLLEEAGLTDDELLGHRRGPGPHGLGCWALDTVLGKS